MYVCVLAICNAFSSFKKNPNSFESMDQWCHEGTVLILKWVKFIFKRFLCLFYISSLLDSFPGSLCLHE